MSPHALARCKTLTIKDIPMKEGEYRKHLEVRDPQVQNKVIDEMDVRTPQDLSRVKRAFMSKHRIPPQNVKEVEDGGDFEGAS